LISKSKVFNLTLKVFLVVLAIHFLEYSLKIFNQSLKIEVIHLIYNILLKILKLMILWIQIKIINVYSLIMLMLIDLKKNSIYYFIYIIDSIIKTDNYWLFHMNYNN